MTRNYQKPADLSAVQAKMGAQKIAFSAITFEATVCLLRLGILRTIADAGRSGISAADLAESLDLSKYGIQVLLDMGLTMNLVWLNDNRYVLDKIGHFLLTDEMTEINVNFAQDVCYEAMGHLMASIKSGKPEGLKVFGDWPTVYHGVASFPEPAKSSWFAFNGYYSKGAFAQALPIVFASRPTQILDVGGHLGAFAFDCIEYDADVQVTLVDLPEQVAIAMQYIAQHNAQDRVDTQTMDFLDPQQSLPVGADTIWMSQFLDCFSESQVETILNQAARIMSDDSSLYILELFWDCQEYEIGAYGINATSLYFTCIANGVSRMYHSNDIISIAEKAGFAVYARYDGLGFGHTLLHLKKAR